jgi:hypothetical protein
MKYMLIHCIDETAEFGPEAGNEQGRPTFDAWLAEMADRGVTLHGERLRDTSSATTVQVRDREVLLSDGPFAETKEQVAGYDVIECADLDEAIEVASKHPTAWFGTIEVRPIRGDKCGGPEEAAPEEID